jgi:hypothetical protein
MMTSMPHPRSDTASPLRPPRTPLAAVRRADAELRRIVVRVRAWGLERGRACSTDALTAVVGVAVEEARRGRASPRCWTEARVTEVLTTGVSSFCADRELTLPPGLAPAMALWLDYLAAQGALDCDSDPVERLRLTAGAEGRRTDGRRRRSAGHPASGGGR